MKTFAVLAVHKDGRLYAHVIGYDIGSEVEVSGMSQTYKRQGNVYSYGKILPLHIAKNGLKYQINAQIGD